MKRKTKSNVKESMQDFEPLHSSMSIKEAITFRLKAPNGLTNKNETIWIGRLKDGILKLSYVDFHDED